jgi:hypothetical protein
MGASKSASGTTVQVIEVLANGDERFEVRWPPAADQIPLKDWRQVRDVNFEIDTVTGEAVLSFTRNNTRNCTVRPRR